MTTTKQSFHTILACALVASFAQASRVHALQASVAVTVETAGGDPLADAPVEVSSYSDVAFGFTDDAGRATFQLEVGPDDPSIDARLWNGAGHRNLSPDERVLAYDRYEHFINQYRLKPCYIVSTTPGQTQYQFDIVAEPAVEATGRVVDAQGEPVEAFFYVRGGAWDGMAGAGETFRIRAIPQGAAAELWFTTASPELHVRPLTPAQTQADIALGDVVIQDHDRPVPLEMTVDNAEGLYDPGDVPLWKQVSLVRADAEVLLTFPVKPPDGEVVAEVVAVQTDVPRTTEGVYYVAPGPLAAPTALALLDALRAGRHAELDAAGAPRFTAAGGQTTQFTLDAAEARDAILDATQQGP